MMHIAGGVLIALGVWAVFKLLWVWALEADYGRPSIGWMIAIFVGFLAVVGVFLS